MTVAELIEALKDKDADAEVYIGTADVTCCRDCRTAGGLKSVRVACTDAV